MKFETSAPVLVVKDESFAKDLNMSEGKFYTYYKPGYANGFGNYAGQDIDFAYLQACEQVCRDEFTPDSDYIGSDEFQSALK